MHHQKLNTTSIGQSNEPLPFERGVKVQTTPPRPVIRHILAYCLVIKPLNYELSNAGLPYWEECATYLNHQTNIEGKCLSANQKYLMSRN